jgi:cellulose biosynthesis protein BcsQ
MEPSFETTDPADNNRDVSVRSKERTPKVRESLPAEPSASTAPYNPYNPPISRKLMERIVGVSTPMLVRYEQDNLIKARKVKHGGAELITYQIKDVHAVLKKRGISYNKTGKAEVIALFSQKGGVGKSSYTQQLAAMLSLVGTVLVLDLDSQADATSLFNVNVRADLVENDELEPSIMELIDWRMKDGSDVGIKQLDFDDVVVKVSDTLHVVPADLDLNEVNYNLNRLPIVDRIRPDGSSAPGALFVIKEVVDKVSDRYDFILFDLPPNVETANVAALYAANRILIPLELEAKCLKTMARNSDFLERLVSSGAGFSWSKILIVPNKFLSTNIKMKALARIQDIFQGREDIHLSQAVVPSAAIIDRCADLKEPVFVAATKTGKEHRSSVGPAKQFSDMFWVIMHEILDIDVERLLFADNDGMEN